ncbi:hypothetical protein JCM17961_39870 [Endothiovibrio diazotrophicus]
MKRPRLPQQPVQEQRGDNDQRRGEKHPGHERTQRKGTEKCTHPDTAQYKKAANPIPNMLRKLTTRCRPGKCPAGSGWSVYGVVEGKVAAGGDDGDGKTGHHVEQ